MSKKTEWRMAEHIDEVGVTTFTIGGEVFLGMEVDGVGILMPGALIFDVIDEAVGRPLEVVH
jgi:hypothetical protein